ncbi:MAG: HAD family hydrolase [Desulfovibrionaceae bacterium]|nr:HAD family hydrolase [Desulfovibrionaceae bacterium]
MSSQSSLAAASIRGVIFDCDGVMIDSAVANTMFYNRIREYFGLPPMTREQERYTMMATARQAMEYVTPEELHPELDRICREEVIYRRDIMPLITLMPGFLEFVAWLHEQGIALAIHTNRIQRGIDHVLQTFAIPPYFKPIMTAELAAPKPSPEGVHAIQKAWGYDARAMLFVGDSPLDKAAAEAAGVPFAAFGSLGLAGDICAPNYTILQQAVRPLLAAK